MDNTGTKQDAVYIAEKLRQAGFTALLAGGCVRDMLMGIEPKDYDIATDATPKQIQKIFKKVLMVGAQFGVAMVLHKSRVTECATFRADADYSDGRRPDSIKFADAKADALRRDFTINGMFMDPVTDEVIDYVGGRQDIERRVIRAIGNAQERFSEDFLRILRAIRFATRLGFTLDEDTCAAIKNNSEGLKKISGERILDELGKILTGPDHLKAMGMIQQLNLTETVLGESLSESSNFQTAIARMKNMPPICGAKKNLACLYASTSSICIKKMCSKWGASNSLKLLLLDTAKNINTWQTAANWPLCELKKLIAGEHFQTISEIWRAEEKRCNNNNLCCDRIAERVSSIAPEKISPAPFINGGDLMDMGLGEGPLLGKILREIYDMQLNETICDKNAAIKKAAELLRHQ